MDVNGSVYGLEGENYEKLNYKHQRRQQMPKVYVCLAIVMISFLEAGLFALLLSRLHVGSSSFWQLMNPWGFIIGFILTVITILVYLAMTGSGSTSDDC